MGVFIRSKESPDCKDMKKYMWEGYFPGTLFWGFSKADMAKTLGNELSMIETNSLNHNLSDFAIKSGLALHQFQKKTAVRRRPIGENFFRPMDIMSVFQ